MEIIWVAVQFKEILCDKSKKKIFIICVSKLEILICCRNKNNSFYSLMICDKIRYLVGKLIKHNGYRLIFLCIKYIEWI